MEPLSNAALQNLRDEEMKREMLQASSGDRDPISAVLTLQRWVRGILARNRVRQENEDEMVFLGMMPPPNDPEDHFAKAEAVRRKRNRIQADYEQEYMIGLDNVRNDVEETRGAEFKEHMWMERYHWWIQQKEQVRAA